jgi:hypothetical protein
MLVLHRAIRNYLFICFVLITCTLVGQDTSQWQMIQVLPIQSKSMQADRMGNFYVVTPNNQLFKYNAKFERIATLNYVFSGSIDAVDVSNPLEIYLFYKELNQVIVLDNNLAYRGKLNLTDWGITQAACIGRSYDNGIWIFDLGDFQLKKFDKTGSLIQSSGNFRQFSQSSQLVPIACIDDGNRLFLIDEISGIYIFDVFGSFIKKHQIEGIKFVQIEKDCLYFLKDNSVFELKAGAQRKRILEGKDTGLGHFSFQNTYILLQQPNQIRQFRLLE